ncbi:hypothetical protein PSMK_01850 [Phycisphaera mikurensis NBRC 102666]|uniref:Uncharacterized protein n=1 Tax=Phycisphaera mikurensis (strain NBRC 102666 / KCTC 22515 / FYK2301M01) TaxID=1142394 RepID=I0IAQ6_PHYMF|nr:hypothetical protein PSMK_01850 [Phycisphaera mikurensis NBRC 102666]
MDEPPARPQVAHRLRRCRSRPPPEAARVRDRAGFPLPAPPSA